MILPNFPKNCMKLKEFGPPGGARDARPPLNPPLINSTMAKPPDCVLSAGTVFREHSHIIYENENSLKYVASSAALHIYNVQTKGIQQESMVKSALNAD